MGVCCCSRSNVAEGKAQQPHRGSDAYHDELPALNPFTSTHPAGLHTPTKGTVDCAAVGDGSTDRASTTSAEAYMLTHGYRRRGAICGETLSPYLQNVRWWVRQKNERNADDAQLGDKSEELQREREVVRRVLLNHPFFTSCLGDAALLEEMLDAFERRSTPAGASITAPGDVAAFHVVVEGGAVSAAVTPSEAEMDGVGGPLQSTSVAVTNTQDDTEADTRGQEQTHALTDHRGPCSSSSGHRWGAGDAFGDEGLLYPLSQDYPDASVVADDAATRKEGDGGRSSSTSHTVTWCLSRVRYQQLLRLHHDDQLRRVLQLLSQCPLFAHLSAEEVFRLAERATVTQHDAAVPLLGTGEPPADLSVLLSGTVAVEHERANGFGGRARIQAAILTPGDCVGDVEWLADTTAAARGVACPAAYAYTTQQPCEVVRLSLLDLADVLSAEDMAAMRQHSRNISAGEQWLLRVRQSLRSLVEQSLLAPLSDTDGDSTSEEEGEEETSGGLQPYGASASSAALQLHNSRAPLAKDDVTVKGVDVTNFLLAHFFSRPTYQRANGRERGLSMAAFSARRSYPCGTVLFDVAYTTSSTAESGAVRRGSIASAIHDDHDAAAAAAAATVSDDAGVLHVRPDRLYVVVSGEISVVDTQRANTRIFSVGRGASVGEEGLLPPLHCSPAGQLRTRTIVTSAEGCEVHELRAKTFREFLRRPYTAGIRNFCGVFSVLPYAEYFPENYWRFLFHCAAEKEVVGGDLVGVRGARCASVALLLDGQVRAYRGSSGGGSGVDADGRPASAVASFGRGDIVGGWEAAEGVALSVAYVCECRTRFLAVPAESFAGLFRPAMAYLRTLWSQQNYEAVR